MTFYEALVFLGHFVLLINIILIAILRKRLTGSLRLVLVLLIGVFIIQISSSLLALNGKSNQFLSHYLHNIECFVLSIHVFFLRLGFVFWSAGIKGNAQRLFGWDHEVTCCFF